MTETVQLTLFESEALEKWIQEYSSTQKISETSKRKRSEATKAAWARGVYSTPEVRLRYSQSRRKRDSPTEATRLKISKTRLGMKFTEEHKQNMSIAHQKRKLPTEATKRKMSASQQGITLDEWTGYRSYLPYCNLFNSRLKERIRNRDNRTCVLCGKGEIQNGRRLSVHHIDADKMQGCNNKPWYLCALCTSCNFTPDTVEKEFLIVTNLHGSRVNMPTSTNISGSRIV